MKVTIKRDRNMDLENTCGQMVLDMMETGLIIKYAEEYIIIF
jgi:hypothetical protein